MSTQTFNIADLAKYLKPEASADLNRFMDSVPEHVGKFALIAGGIAWASAAGLGMYTMIQTQELAKLKTELNEKQASKIAVPTVIKGEVTKDSLEKFIKSIDTVYPDVTFRVNKNKVTVSAKELSAYGQFREAIGHLANADKRWVASVESLCVGRECKVDKLAAVITLNTIKIN